MASKNPCSAVCLCVPDTPLKAGSNCARSDALFPLRRVLIYLEAAALGRPKPAFAAHLTQTLLAAAVSLGLRSLQVCQQGFQP